MQWFTVFIAVIGRSFGRVLMSEVTHEKFATFDEDLAFYYGLYKLLQLFLGNFLDLRRNRVFRLPAPLYGYNGQHA
jgi:hypothetical protein